MTAPKGKSPRRASAIAMRMKRSSSAVAAVASGAASGKTTVAASAAMMARRVGWTAAQCEQVEIGRMMRPPREAITPPDSQAQVQPRVRLFRGVGLPQQSRFLHLVVQRDGIPIVTIRPRQRAVLDEDPRKVSRILERFGHRTGLLGNERKVPHTNSAVGKFDLKLVVADRADAD